MKSDIEIARETTALSIREIARKLDIPESALFPYGNDAAKIDLNYLSQLPEKNTSKLILVTAISPTPAGEGKTTTTIGLGDALQKRKKKTAICLREPSLGPCFGVKGGAAGGGYAQVIPMEKINLHFTGDFHAITAANNLLAAMIDNHIYWGKEPHIDARRVTWHRVVDMNDRALRCVVNSLGGVTNGFPREDKFDITVASEVMAIFCLARDLKDLQERLNRIVIGYTRDKKPVTAKDIKASGAMAVLLKEAMSPNLVQTLEGTPAFVHGGPFANIAHGCNSVIATSAGLKLADYVVTEAGFGADLGAQKFFDIKCRLTGLSPSAVVIVATIRALKMHGGVTKEGLGQENLQALKTGLSNLERHVTNLRRYGLPVVVAINEFLSDTAAEHALVKDVCEKEYGAKVVLCRHWAQGAEGALELADEIIRMVDEKAKSSFQVLYPDDISLLEKVRCIAQKIYGAKDIEFPVTVEQKLKSFEEEGYQHLPVCIAKTQYSFSTDASLRGAPSDHILSIRDVRLSAGAGFIVIICGDIMTMPGLPKVPAAENIALDAQGQVVGLF